MAIVCGDDALTVVQVVTGALRAMFDPDSTCPPEGGGTKDVRFFANGIQGIPGGLMTDCSEGPLVWVQLMSRYRARRAEFPSPTIKDGPCNDTSVVPAVLLEIGVARCAMGDGRYVDWDKIATEELISLDDSWRIEQALQLAVCRLRSKTRAVSTDSVAPIGPDGGARAWTAPIYVQLERVS